MLWKKTSGKKVNKTYNILRIIVLIGWISFLFYSLYLVRYLGNDYIRDPSNFVFFNDEQHREAYYIVDSTLVYNTDWISKASLIDQCRPMIYINDFYFNKVDLFVKLSALLILLTLFLKTDPREWRDMGKKIEKFSEKFEDDGTNK